MSIKEFKAFLSSNGFDEWSPDLYIFKGSDNEKMAIDTSDETKITTLYIGETSADIHLVKLGTPDKAYEFFTAFEEKDEED